MQFSRHPFALKNGTLPRFPGLGRAEGSRPRRLLAPKEQLGYGVAVNSQNFFRSILPPETTATIGP